MPNNRDENRGENSSSHTSKPTSLMYAVGAGSDAGKWRKPNEDSIFAASRTWDTHTSPLSIGLFVVADGIGAYANGQDASSGAIQAIVDCILPKVVRGNAMRSEACCTLLTEAVQLANRAVNQQNIDLHKQEGTDIDVAVGTTVTAAMVVGSTAYVANVGNCRTYLYRAHEGLKQVTTDHTIVARFVADGILTPEDVYTHQLRRQLSRALFNKPSVEVDCFTMPLQPDDTLLLCSPGLWSIVRDSQIEDVISHTLPDPSKAAEALIQAALDNDGKDNISGMVVLMLKAQDQIIAPDAHVFTKPDNVHIPQA